MELAHRSIGIRSEVVVKPIVRGIPCVYLGMSIGPGACGCDLTEDEARMLAQALLDAIEQSKALTAREAG